MHVPSSISSISSVHISMAKVMIASQSCTKMLAYGVTCFASEFHICSIGDSVLISVIFPRGHIPFETLPQFALLAFCFASTRTSTCSLIFQPFLIKFLFIRVWPSQVDERVT